MATPAYMVRMSVEKLKDDWGLQVAFDEVSKRLAATLDRLIAAEGEK